MKFKNQKGFTLVELMIVLALITVVVLTSIKLYDSSDKGSTKTSNMINLQQETNFLIQEIQSAYNKGENDPRFGTRDIQFKVSDSLIISELYSNGNEEGLKGVLKNIDHKKPLRIQLTTETEDDTDNEIYIDTTFNPNEDKTIILK